MQEYCIGVWTLASHFDARLATFRDYDLLNGSVLVAEGDLVLYERGFGDANLAWGIPNAPETKFRIGSVTKQFTAALVLQLFEEGLVNLEIPITRYLPTYPTAQSSCVNVHHLLSHTSGIPSYTTLPSTERFIRDPHTPDDFLATFSGLELEFEPGTRFSYSNSGYYLLGVVIEHVTGQPYAHVLKQRLLAPLGLHDTGYDSYTEIIKKLAAGYTWNGSTYQHAAYLDPSVPYAAGMMNTTVGDLFRWTRALHRGEPFKRRRTFERMATAYLGDYGYGLRIYDVPIGMNSVASISHGGGINGFSSIVRFLPDKERMIVVLDNTKGDVEAVADALALILYDQLAGSPKQSILDFFSSVLQAEGVEAAINSYCALTTRELQAYYSDEHQFDLLGRAYLKRGNIATALRILELNAYAYPSSWRVYHGLGEAYVATQDLNRAVLNYRRALSFHPASTSTKAALEQLAPQVM